MQSGRPAGLRMGALDAYFPAVLALGGQIVRAEELQSSCFKMWELYDLEPELIDFSDMSIVEDGYPLRPEIIESAYYLYHFTEDGKYLIMAKKFWDDINQYCKTDYGFTEVTSVYTKEKGNKMHSFFLSETLKYFYLIFSDDEPINFNDVIFTTEAHPLKREKIYKLTN
jgi:mannosidase alpha-like ER degradation enhancer 2